MIGKDFPDSGRPLFPVVVLDEEGDSVELVFDS